MKQRWVDKKEEEQRKKKEKIYGQLRERMAECLDDDEIEMVMKAVDDCSRLGLCRLGVPIDDVWARRKQMYENDIAKCAAFSGRLCDLMIDTKGFMYSLAECTRDYSRYLDSELVEFDGDIIITDPCYFIKDNDWAESGYGEDVEQYGIKHYMARDTIYGDWSCTVFDKKKKAIGTFCADSGMVAVADLGEVLKYNPGFNYHVDRTWTTALIKDFKGSVRFIVKHHSRYDDFEVQVVGNGINKIIGEEISFVGRQTGF